MDSGAPEAWGVDQFSADSPYCRPEGQGGSRGPGSGATGPRLSNRYPEGGLPSFSGTWSLREQSASSNCHQSQWPGPPASQRQSRHLFTDSSLCPQPLAALPGGLESELLFPLRAFQGGSLYSRSWPGILGNPPASAPRMLKLQV